MRYSGHGDPVRRFWSKVNKQTGTDACWLWTAGVNDDGYGRFRLDGKIRKAHRVSYELEIGPIASGLQLDHLCRTRDCVRPSHLTPATNRENALAPGSLSLAAIRAQRNHCPLGHILAVPNLVRSNYERGQRCCLACHRGKTTVRNHHRRRGVTLDFEVEAHAHYRKIMNEQDQKPAA